MIASTSTFLHLFLLGITLPISSFALTWHADGFKDGARTIYEDDPINITTPLIRVKWTTDKDLTKCSGFKILQSTSISKTELKIQYKDGDSEAKIYSDDLLQNLIPDVKSISVELGITCNFPTKTDWFTVGIKPVNLNTPKIGFEEGTERKYTIKENQNNFPFKSMIATDKDMLRGGEMENLDIKLEAENNDGYFKIESTKNDDNYKVELKLLRALDYETQNRYDLRIVVTDESENRPNAIPQKTGDIMLSIEVQDVHDQHPEFIRDCPILKVEEETAVGTNVTTMTARDGDSNVKPPGIMRYKIEGDCKNQDKYVGKRNIKSQN